MRKLQFYFDLQELQIIVCNDRYVVPCSGEFPITFQALPEGIKFDDVVGPYTVSASANGEQYCALDIGLTWVDVEGESLLGMVADDYMALAAAIATGHVGQTVTLEFTPRGAGLSPEVRH